MCLESWISAPEARLFTILIRKRRNDEKTSIPGERPWPPIGGQRLLYFEATLPDIWPLCLTFGRFPWPVSITKAASGGRGLPTLLRQWGCYWNSLEAAAYFYRGCCNSLFGCAAFSDLFQCRRPWAPEARAAQAAQGVRLIKAASQDSGDRDEVYVTMAFGNCGTFLWMKVLICRLVCFAFFWCSGSGTKECHGKWTKFMIISTLFT